MWNPLACTHLHTHTHTLSPNRYFGLGRTVMCLHQDAILPAAMELPPRRITYSLNAQLMWLKQEAAELCQVPGVCTAVWGRVLRVLRRCASAVSGLRPGTHV
jgi:hypothetical protein